MKLSVFSNKVFFRTSEGLKTTGGFPIQIDELAKHFDEVLLAVRMSGDSDLLGNGVSAENVRIGEMASFSGPFGFAVRTPLLKRQIMNFIEETDLSLILLPCYVGALASLICRRVGAPAFQMVGGDWVRSLRANRSTAVTRKLADIFISPILHNLMKNITCDTLTFFNGMDIYGNCNGRQNIFVSSTVRRADICEIAPALPTDGPTRLLYVGRLSTEKGVFYLLEAVELLMTSGFAVSLTLAGKGALEHKLRSETFRMGVEEAVSFRGFVSHGEDLWRLYRENHIVVIPSTTDQQPKVMIEAMSQSRPVIATRVGGMATAIENGENGILVSPEDPQAIAKAVKRVACNRDLVRKLTRNALQFAAAHSVEREMGRIAGIVYSSYNARKMGARSIYHA